MSFSRVSAGTGVPVGLDARHGFDRHRVGDGVLQHVADRAEQCAEHEPGVRPGINGCHAHRARRSARAMISRLAAITPAPSQISRLL
jgi:hypothetical protein